MIIVVGFFGIILIFALWLEYRHRCRCRFRHNPYELIDLQEEYRRQREGNNEKR